MKNILKVILIITIGLSFLNCSKKDEKRVFVVGTTADYTPFEYLENGQIVGFDPDIIEAIFKKIDYEYKWSNMEFGGLFPALQTKKLI